MGEAMSFSRPRPHDFRPLGEPFRKQDMLHRLYRTLYCPACGATCEVIQESYYIEEPGRQYPSQCRSEDSEEE